MLQEIQDLQRAVLAGLTVEQYDAIEQKTLEKIQATNVAYSMYALAMNIVFCIEVFQYETKDSEICSIVASALFMVCHIYNGKKTGYFVSAICVLPIYIAGFVIGKQNLLNIFVFVFQFVLWQGEYFLWSVIDENLKLKSVRDARKKHALNIPENLQNLKNQVDQQFQEAQDMIKIQTDQVPIAIQ